MVIRRNEWTQSSTSQDNSCVQVRVGATQVEIRDSNDAEQVTVHFTHASWRRFVEGVKSGEFDL
jgi:Domain of unknown function (DUF397).